MNIKEKIGSFYVMNNKNNNVVFILNFDKLPTNYQFPISLGLFSLKRKTVYKLTLTVFDDNNTIVVHDTTLKIDTNSIDINPDSVFTDEYIGSTFQIMSPIVNVVGGPYTIQLELFNSADELLDTAKTYIYTKQG